VQISGKPLQMMVAESLTIPFMTWGQGVVLHDMLHISFWVLFS